MQQPPQVGEVLLLLQGLPAQDPQLVQAQPPEVRFGTGVLRRPLVPVLCRADRVHQPTHLPSSRSRPLAAPRRLPPVRPVTAARAVGACSRPEARPDARDGSLPRPWPPTRATRPERLTYRLDRPAEPGPARRTFGAPDHGRARPPPHDAADGRLRPCTVPQRATPPAAAAPPVHPNGPLAKRGG